MLSCSRLSELATATPTTPPAATAPAAALAAVALAVRGSDPAIGGRMAQARPIPKPATARPLPDPVREELVLVAPLTEPPMAGRSPLDGVGVVMELGSAPSSPPPTPLPAIPVAVTGGAVDQLQPPPPVSLVAAPMPASCTAAPTASGGVDSGEARGTDDGCDDATMPEKLESPLLGPSSASACNGLSAAAAALEAEAGWEHVGRGRRSGQGTPLEPSREGLERSLAFKRWARGRCFRCLERGHQVSACREPFRCIRCRRPGHRERFCRASSPVARNRSPVTRAPLQRSRSPSVQPCPSLTRSWAEVVGHSSPCVSVPPRSQSGCCKDSNVNASLVSALKSQLALLRTELLQEIALLRAELRDALAKLEVASVVPLLPELQVGSIVEDAEGFFGDFSPRALHVTPLVRGSAVITEVVAPVLQIMPELHELCGESSIVLPMELSALESLAVAMTPSLPLSESCQPPAFADCGDLVGSVTASSMAIGHVASLSGEVDETGVLAPNSEALSCEQLETPESIMSVVPVTDDVEAVGTFAPDPSELNQPLVSVEHGGFDVAVTHSHVTVGQVSVRDKVNDILFDLELHSLLKRLERVSPGSGKAIVEEALRSKGKKSDATGKASAAA
jgi:hypothetical protein